MILFRWRGCKPAGHQSGSGTRPIVSATTHDPSFFQDGTAETRRAGQGRNRARRARGRRDRACASSPGAGPASSFDQSSLMVLASARTTVYTHSSMAKCVDGELFALVRKLPKASCKHGSRCRHSNTDFLPEHSSPCPSQTIFTFLPLLMVPYLIVAL